MNLVTRQQMTLEEYLEYEDGTDARYELVDGVLVEMGAESDLNVLIGSFLLVYLARFVPYYCLRRGTEVVVPGLGTTSRFPDLLVLTEAGAAALAGEQRSMVTLAMPVPAVAIEMVSSGKEGSDNYNRDYIEKRAEYAARGIPEYWLIDPARQVVLVLTLSLTGAGPVYQEQRFMGDQEIMSPTFPTLNLTAAQILAAGKDGFGTAN